MRFATDVFRALRSRARRGIWIEGLAAAACLAAAWAVCSFVLDRGLRLEVAFRALILAMGAAVLLRGIVLRLMRPLAVPLGDAELALAVERGDRGINQSLISAVEFEHDLERKTLHGQSETLMRGVVDAMQRRVSQLDIGPAIDNRRVRKQATILGGVLAGVVAISASFPGTVGLWAQRNLLLADVDWPRETTLAFEGLASGATLRVAERDDVTLRVRAEGVIPERVDVEIRFDGGDRAVRAMERTEQGLFTAMLASLLEGATVVARGNDGETPPLRIEIVARPRITDLQVSMTPPAYIGTTEQPLPVVAGELHVPRGSTLHIRGRSTKPLASARLVRDAESRWQPTLSADRLGFTFGFVPDSTGVLQLEVVDTDELGPAQPTLLYVRVKDDAPPQLDFQTRGIGSLITANARLPGALRIRDDFGIDSVASMFRVMEAAPPENGEKPPEPPFEPAGVEWSTELQIGARDAELELAFDLQTLMTDPDPNSVRNKVRPDTLLSIRFDAKDQRAPEAHLASSEVRTVRVVTREKLLQELRRRQNEQRRELERVLQKELEARAELAEILSPTAQHQDAPRARLRVDQLSRQQSALAKSSQAVAERYREILEEMINNRLFEPNVVRAIESKVVSPLITLSLEDLPDSARLIAGFAADGSSVARTASVEALDSIIARLRRIIEQMERTEDLAALVETLRVVIRTEREAQDLVQRMRDAEGTDIFRDREKGKDEKPSDGK